MADPLSIAASIVGLIATAGKIYTAVFDIVSSVSDAPRSMRSVYALVNDIKATLIALQHLLDTLGSLPSRRKELIRLDHVTVCFFECVLTLSELESIVCKPQFRENGFRSRLRWTSIEKRIARILPQLEYQKTCLSLMLTILQCESDLEAVRSRDKMQTTIERILEQNTRLSAKIEHLETLLDEEPRSVRFFDTESTWDTQSLLVTCTSTNERLDSVNSNPKAVAGTASSDRNFPDLREFEFDLHRSRVYSRAASEDCDMSFSSSTIRSNAWSVLSRISLNDISIIAVYRLPVTLDDINRIGRDLTFAMLISNQDNALPPPSQDRMGTISRLSGARRKPNDRSISVRLKGNTVKTVLVGDGCTGKTTLIKTYLTGKYSDEYIPPKPFDDYAVTLNVASKSYTMEIVDTSWFDHYDLLRPVRYDKTNVFLLCYRIGYRDWEASWENIKEKWIPEITYRCPGVSFVIVGIRDAEKVSDYEFRRTDRYMEACRAHKKVAGELGAAGYLTCNVRDPVDVKDVFDEVIIAALERPPIPAKRRPFWRRNTSQTYGGSVGTARTPTGWHINLGPRVPNHGNPTRVLDGIMVTKTVELVEEFRG